MASALKKASVLCSGFKSFHEQFNVYIEEMFPYRINTFNIQVIAKISAIMFGSQ